MGRAHQELHQTEDARRGVRAGGAGEHAELLPRAQRLHGLVPGPVLLLLPAQDGGGGRPGDDGADQVADDHGVQRLLRPHPFRLGELHVHGVDVALDVEQDAVAERLGDGDVC